MSRILYEFMPVHWKYQMLEKSRDKRASLVPLINVVGHKNSKITPCYAFSFEGQPKRIWLAESFDTRQTEQREEAKVAGIVKCKKQRIGIHPLRNL
jgi:hypothetical protein